MIELKDISKAFKTDKGSISILSGLNLRVAKGESVSILGPSGSGKTTLLSILSGLDAPDIGEVIIKQEKIHQMSEDRLSQFRSQHVGIVFQSFYLVPYLTALENVELALDAKKREDREKAISVLKTVGLGERMDHLPHQLSGGESQRVAIARALVVEPDLLIADEPSGNLDRETGKQVMDLLFSLVEKHNTTFILVTHDLSLAERCKRIQRLEKGKLI